MELQVFQFVPVAPCPVSGHHQKEPVPIHLTTPLWIIIGIDKMPSQFSVFQAEQSHISQPFLIREILPVPNHFCGPPLDVLCLDVLDVLCLS